jgi:hypothetical protein
LTIDDWFFVARGLILLITTLVVGGQWSMVKTAEVTPIVGGQWSKRWKQHQSSAVNGQWSKQRKQRHSSKQHTQQHSIHSLKLKHRHDQITKRGKSLPDQFY